MGNSKSKSKLNGAKIILDAKAKYVGSVPVKASTGVDVAENAMIRVQEMHQPEKTVSLTVSPDGVAIFNEGGDLLKQVDINDVTFTAKAAADKSVFCFIQKDESAHLRSCHVFRSKKFSEEFPIAVQESFKIRSASEPAGRKDSFISTVSSTSSLNPDKGNRFKRRNSTRGSFIHNTSYMSQNADINRCSAIASFPEDENKGELLAKYEGVFYGMKPLSEAKSTDALDFAVREIVNEPIQLPGTLLVQEKCLELLNHEEDNQPYHSSYVSCCTTAKYYDDLEVFAYVIHDLRIDLIEAYVVGIPPVGKDEVSIRRMIDRAIKSQSYDTTYDGQKLKKAKTKRKEKEDYDVYEATFVGSVSVRDGASQKVAETCVSLVSGSARKGEDGVLFQMGPSGMRVFDGFTHETKMAIPYSEIRFQTVAGSAKDCITISAKTQLGTVQCHVFRAINSTRAKQILTALNKKIAKVAGQKLKSTPSKKGKDNPFAGQGDRIRSPSNLHKRQIHRADLEAVKIIGAGQFGQVYLAKRNNNGQEELCAVKLLKDVKSEADRHEFVHEAEVMLETEHKNCMGMHGVAVQQKPWLMVLQFMEYGDLRTLLMAAKAKHVTLTLEEFLNLSTECCRGMAYLESIGFAHCDLAARNVLVGQENLCKIADFGMTRRLRNRASWRGPLMMKVAIRWSAAEILTDRVFSIKSDVWAFGILVWEIFNYGDTPYPNMKNPQVMRTVQAGGRMAKSPTMPKEVHELLKTTWNRDPQERPTFDSMCKELDVHFKQASTQANSPVIRDIGLTVKNSVEAAAKMQDNASQEYEYVRQI
eukprot:m.141794 g.141794  ORF g.141794 m.141794 type:complete len:813 (+) comp14863_c0_seq1:208-2646(+)